MKKSSKDILTKFNTGAVRKDKQTRFDLICPSAVRCYAQVCTEGAFKYGERNWEKGIPSSNYINHALDHIFAFMQGDRKENHLGHALWNIAAAIHNEEDCKHELGEN